ncbi:hypothetical protein [Sorangium sp. So ce1182]
MKFRPDRLTASPWLAAIRDYDLGVASFGDDLRGTPNALLEEILR